MMKVISLKNAVSLVNQVDFRNLSIILLVFGLATLVLYQHFFFSDLKMQLVYQNWDGPSYVVIAKSLYNVEVIPQVNSLRLPTEYFAAHFPLYPLAIRLFSFIGYFQSMIFTSVLSTALLLCAFYFLASEYTTKNVALILSLGMIFFTPRWFIVSHVGSSEPQFLLLLCLMILSLNHNRYVLAACMAVLMQLTRIQGILFFVGISMYYVFMLVTKKKTFRQTLKEYLVFLAVPLALLGVFWLYQVQFGNFFAFFYAQELANSASHLQLPPFKVLETNFASIFVLESWKEIYILYYVAISATFVMLFKQKQYLLGFLALAYAIPLYFIVHPDIARYSLPLLPLFFIAFRRQLGTRTALILIFLMIPAILMFSANFMSFNVSP